MENVMSLQELMPLALRINKKWQMPGSNWRVANELASDGKTVTLNRIDQIPVGNGKADLRTLIEAIFAGIVGSRYDKNATMFTNSKDEKVCVFDYVARFLTNPNMKWSLMLYGTPGTGKTCLLQAIHRTLIYLYTNEVVSSQQVVIRYVKASALGEMLKDDRDNYKKHLGCTVLLIDDIGFSGEAEMVNDYGSRRYPVEEIIEHRYDRRLMTICTSNLTKPDFEKHYGQKIFSRFCEMFAFVPMSGRDLRKS